MTIAHADTAILVKMMLPCIGDRCCTMMMSECCEGHKANVGPPECFDMVRMSTYCWGHRGVVWQMDEADGGMQVSFIHSSVTVHSNTMNVCTKSHRTKLHMMVSPSRIAMSAGVCCGSTRLPLYVSAAILHPPLSCMSLAVMTLKVMLLNTLKRF